MFSRPGAYDSLLAAEALDRSPSLDLDKLRPLSLDRLTGGQPVRIGVWGDSHVAGGIITDELMQVLKSLGVETQTNFIPPFLGHPGVARLPLRKFCVSPGWVIEPAYAAKTSAGAGLALASQRSTVRNAHIWLDLRDASRMANVSSLQVQYAPLERPAVVEVSVDEGPFRRLVARNAPMLIQGNGAPISTVKLRVADGTLQLQGFALTYRRSAPVIVDVFGIPSATVRGWVASDPGLLRQSAEVANYDAVVLEYGTNEGNSPKFEPASYRAELAESLSAMRRIFPSSSCLLLGPGDRGVRPGYAAVRRGRRASRRLPGKQDPLKFSRIHASINAIQAEVGAQFGCAAWNWQAAMGGSGAAHEWATANPPLMGGDLTHLTTLGYRATADALASALGWTAVPFEAHR